MVKEKSIGTVPKTSLESDAQPVVPGSPACSLSVRVKSPDLLWVVCSEFLDSMPSVVEAASLVFDQVQVIRLCRILGGFRPRETPRDDPGVHARSAHCAAQHLHPPGERSDGAGHLRQGGPLI